MAAPNVPPFDALAEALRDLRDCFARELALDNWHSPPSPHLMAFRGHLTALITNLEHMGSYLGGLERHDKPAYEAFRRALDRQ